MISVIVPMYNAEKYIRRCIESILIQTYKDLEIIVVNDGSEDKSEEICTMLENKDHRINIISIENRGVSNARNVGLNAANGEYISFIDADDYIDSDYIEKYQNIAKLTQADVVIGGVQQEDGKQHIAYGNENGIIERENIQKLVCALLDNKNDEQIQYSTMALGFSFCKMYKKSVINNIRFDENIPIREDAIFNARIFLNSNRIAVIENTGYHYVIHSSSATGHYRENFYCEVQNFLKSCRNIWIENNLPMSSFYIGGMYMYMRWLKLHVLHIGSGYTKSQEILKIKNSFNDMMWREVFDKVNITTLNSQYRLLRLLFKYKQARGIRIICRISERRRIQ